MTSATPGAAYVKDPEDEFVAYNEVEMPEPPVNPDEPHSVR